MAISDSSRESWLTRIITSGKWESFIRSFVSRQRILPRVESPNAHRTAWTKEPGSDINLERVSTRRVESLHTENREDSYLKPRRMKRTTHAHTHTEKKKGDPAAKTCPCAPSCSCATFALSLGKGGECIYTSKSSAAMTTTSIGPELFFLPPAPPISILY